MSDSRFPEGTLRPELAEMFRGLTIDGYDAEDTMRCLYEDDRVTWDAPFVATLAERIFELSAIVVQNALVGAVAPLIVDEPEPAAAQTELSPERKAQLEAARARATKREPIL